jgi:hypothetical protein
MPRTTCPLRLRRVLVSASRSARLELLFRMKLAADLYS